MTRRTTAPSESLDLLSLQEAAAKLGLSVSGMQRLIARSKRRLAGYPVNGPTICFYQASPRARIKLDLDSIGRYIEACVCRPDEAPLISSVAKPEPTAQPSERARRDDYSSVGFDPRLLDL